MKNIAKNGFTLIELLVVVLIIRILASVALPQYTKAVEKARTIRLLPNLRYLKNEIELYYMANGAYPDDAMTNMDVDILVGETFNVEITVLIIMDILLMNMLVF